jgi:hypothetical protein
MDVAHPDELLHFNRANGSSWRISLALSDEWNPTSCGANDVCRKVARASGYLCDGASSTQDGGDGFLEL